MVPGALRQLFAWIDEDFRTEKLLSKQSIVRVTSIMNAAKNYCARKVARIKEFHQNSGNISEVYDKILLMKPSRSTEIQDEIFRRKFLRFGGNLHDKI